MSSACRNLSRLNLSSRCRLDNDDKRHRGSTNDMTALDPGLATGQPHLHINPGTSRLSGKNYLSYDNVMSGCLYVILCYVMLCYFTCCVMYCCVVLRYVMLVFCCVIICCVYVVSLFD